MSTNVVGADPVTCEVSGGIDSGILAARARKLFGDRLLAGISLVSPYIAGPTPQSMKMAPRRTKMIPLRWRGVGVGCFRREGPTPEG